MTDLPPENWQTMNLDENGASSEATEPLSGSMGDMATPDADIEALSAAGPEMPSDVPEGLSEETDLPPDADDVDTLIAARKAQWEAFADLSLWEVLVRGMRAPRATWRMFWATVNVNETAAALDAVLIAPVQEESYLPEAVERRTLVAEGAPMREIPAATERAAPLAWHQIVALLLTFVGLLLALMGSSIMMAQPGTRRTEIEHLNVGAPWLLLGCLFWLAAGAVVYHEALLGWGARLSSRLGRQAKQAEAAEEDFATGTADEAMAEPGDETIKAAWGWPFVARVNLWLQGAVQTHSARTALAGLGALLCWGAYAFNANNTFTSFGVFVWISSIVVWLAVLAPPDFDAVAWAQARRAQWERLVRQGVVLRVSWTAMALVLILIVATYFRLNDLSGAPPQMTSDHVEKLLDAQRVLDGTTQIFFPNNGGREGLQMYLVAAFSQLTGLGMQFITLKLVSVLEGLITIPFLWWMGRALIGEDEPELGNAVGLILAALVAVSYWHVALSRLALRIVLTPLIMALIMVYLGRAMRHNRRGDFLKAGVALGVGLYCYQAVRMVPVLMVLGVAIAILFRARTWAERRRYGVNFAVLVLIAVVIFVPLGRFMLDFPNLFWMRTAGRLLGDDVITETDPETGAITEREATLEDRINALNANLPVLGDNLRNALLMFNWKGDVAWINGAPNEPAMDLITGSLLALGLAAWLVRLFQKRDVVDWIILPGIFIMLLPSALSIAFPVENPSATRISGSLPLVYLIAAYGLAFFLWQFEAVIRRLGRWDWMARVTSVAVAAALVWGAYGYNSRLYFGEYADRYRVASLPYTVAGQVLRDFVQTGGSYGNAFMVAYPYWLDHRAIGIEGGRINWPNGLFSVNDLRQWIRDNMGTPYAFDPQRPVLFFYNQNDSETPAVLQHWFPDGRIDLRLTGDVRKDFYTFTALPPGEAWLSAFLSAE